MTSSAVHTLTATNRSLSNTRNKTRSKRDLKIDNQQPINVQPDTPRYGTPRANSHIFAVHSTTRTSCLSKDNPTTPSFAGFRNLMTMVLVVSNLRLMIENYRKYGWLICIRCHDIPRQDLVYGSILFFLVPCHLFVAFTIEYIAAARARAAIAESKKSDDKSLDRQERERRGLRTVWYAVAVAHGINASMNLVIATIVVYSHIHHPGIGTLCEFHAVIVWLKTCSYAFTCRDLRYAMLHPQSNPVPEFYKACPYPRNVTLGNLTYFWWAPTLIYQPVYPRTEHIRWSFVLKRALEVVGLSLLIWIASAQYAAPLLQNSLGSISSLDLVTMLERLMKLSTISLFCWLCGFFALFQSFLNGLAEITRFGDREFYGEWWNSASLRQYWALWNKPVYLFMKRHIYSPMVGRGVPPIAAQILTFFFSGILHEICVGVPTHNILGGPSYHRSHPANTDGK